VPAK
jgi:hypothetical protein